MGTDSLYYIMDYSGNYYRTNQADQLVSVVSQQDAMVFTFAQANSRICVGKKAAFYCMIPIEDSEDETDAAECEEVSPDEEMGVNDMEKQENTGVEEYFSPVKELTYDELTEQAEKDVSSYDLSEIDWAEYLTHFTYLVEGLKDYREDLASKHSDIDQKICDILHYIELCETNDEEAIDLIGLLRVCRENRREIKDELQRIEYFQNNLGTSANAAKAKQALKCIKGLENRKYRPRKYEKLFENCILRDKDPSKAELRGMQIGYEDRKQKFSMEHTYTYEGGEETMFEERKETPYDGKENDWLAFAKQQAEFYKNAGQYITNLQLDIRELEDEIEAILLKTEDAHCNAAQGYKVFKRLRELRIEKKAKTKELNCLYALTDYMDCDALADTCEDNLAEIKGIMEVQEADDVTRIQPVEKEEKEIQVVANIKDMVG